MADVEQDGDGENTAGAASPGSDYGRLAPAPTTQAAGSLTHTVGVGQQIPSAGQNATIYVGYLY